MESYKKIVITRAKSVYGSALNIAVELDGASVGILSNGGSVTVHTSDGPHALAFKKGNKLMASLSVLVEPEQDVLSFTAKVTGNQRLELTPDASTVRSVQGAPTVQSAPAAGAASPAPAGKSKGPARKIALGALIVVVLIAVVGALGGGGESDPSTAASAAPSATPEELATQALAEATADFQEGDYRSAIERCNEISADYPDTQVAAQMSTYLSEQYALFPSIAASELMSAYTDNVVNADQQYTDTVLRVSGTVSRIDTTNGGSNLVVLLDSGSYFSSVQLNFDSDQADAVAALQQGDSVTALGECTGQSGNVLLVLESQNVMVEDCYLIP